MTYADNKRMKRAILLAAGVLSALPTHAGWHYVHHRHVTPAPVVVVQPPTPPPVDPRAYSAYLEYLQRTSAEAEARRQAQIRAIVAAQNARPKEDPVALDARTVKFLQERVEQGSLDARYDLAQRHLEGRGVTQNRAEACRLLQEAAEQDHEPSKKLLKQLAEKPSTS
jgi:TPR repeat protein